MTLVRASVSALLVLLGCASSSGRTSRPTSYRAGYIPPATAVPPRPSPTVAFGARDAGAPTTFEAYPGDQVLIRTATGNRLLECYADGKTCRLIY